MNPSQTSEPRDLYIHTRKKYTEQPTAVYIVYGVPALLSLAPGECSAQVLAAKVDLGLMHSTKACVDASRHLYEPQAVMTYKLRQRFICDMRVTCHSQH